MTDRPLTLRDIALKASDRFGGVRGRALGREAEKAGVKIVYTTIDKIIAGTYTSRPTDATLQALATLAQVPLEDVYRAAEQPIPQASFAEQLPAGVDTLTPAQRETVLALVRQFVAQNRETWELRSQIVHGLAAGGVPALTVLRTALDRAESEHGDVPVPDELLQSREALEAWLEDVAARDTGQLSKGQQRRANADRAGEPATDDPEDLEPR